MLPRLLAGSLVVVCACGTIVEPEPDEGEVGSLDITATAPAEHLRTGGSALVAIEVTRSDGAEGEVAITAETLPSGVTLAPVILPGDQSQTQLVLLAADDADHGIFSVTVDASTTLGASASAEIELAVGGAPGELDTSFDEDGVALIGTGNRAGRGVRVAPDGTLLITGSNVDALLTRLLPDGSVDDSWGSGGTAATGVGDFSNCLTALVHSDGGIYCSGASNGTSATSDVDLAIHAYDDAGAPRATFDGDGIYFLDPPDDSFSEASVLAEASNGDLIAAGNQFILPGFTPTNTLGLRIATDGTLVPSYTIEEAGVAVQGGTLLADDKLVLVGGSGGDWWIKRYDSAGDADSSFGTAGEVTGPGGTAHGVLDLDGSLLVVGVGNGQLVSAAFANSGAPLSTYGTDGVLASGLDFSTRALNAAVRDSQGRIVVVGRDAGRVAVARLTPEGFVDTTFGVGGKVIIDTDLVIDGQRSGGYGIDLDASGRIVVAGAGGEQNLGEERTIVARLWP